MASRFFHGWRLLSALASALISPIALAADDPTHAAADTLWVAVSAMLVFSCKQVLLCWKAVWRGARTPSTCS